MLKLWVFDKRRKEGRKTFEIGLWCNMIDTNLTQKTNTNPYSYKYVSPNPK